MPAASSLRSASISTPAPPRTGAVSRRVCSSTSTVADGQRAEHALRAASRSSARADHDLDPLAADLRLQLVGRAVRDRACRGR